MIKTPVVDVTACYLDETVSKEIVKEWHKIFSMSMDVPKEMIFGKSPMEMAQEVTEDISLLVFLELGDE